MAERVRVLDVLFRYLCAEKVTVVFGVPGGLLHPFFAEVENRDDFSLIVARHEEGAAFMADGYFRACREMAVCAGTGGPGATNMITGVSVAFAEGVPMLVLTGQVPSTTIGRGAPQETGREDIDIVAMFKPITKYSAMVTSAESLARHVRRAIRRALTGRPGPVHLNFPVDLWDAEVEEDWFEPSTYRPNTTTFDRDAVASAAELLLDARRPVVLVGSGVTTPAASQNLKALVELIGALVTTTPRAKGVFPEDHAASLGVLGYAGHRAAAKVLFGDEVDVLLSVGASLNEATTGFKPEFRPSGALLQLDIDADRIGRNYPVDVALVGDAEAVLKELVYHLHRLLSAGTKHRSEWGGRSPHRQSGWFTKPEMRASEQSPLLPQRWRAELNEVLPQDALVFSDVGGHLLFNIHHLLIREGQGFVANMEFASMGHGTVAPIGAAIASPSRPIVAIVGDACFMMNGMEVLTAAEYDIPVVWIVENNHMHGITYHGGLAIDHRLDAVKYNKKVDVAALAAAMGVRSERVDESGQIADVFRRAVAAKEPFVIEVLVDETIAPPLGDRARSIKA